MKNCKNRTFRQYESEQTNKDKERCRYLGGNVISVTAGQFVPSAVTVESGTKLVDTPINLLIEYYPQHKAD